MSKIEDTTDTILKEFAELTTRNETLENVVASQRKQMDEKDSTDPQQFIIVNLQQTIKKLQEEKEFVKGKLVTSQVTVASQRETIDRLNADIECLMEIVNSVKPLVSSMGLDSIEILKLLDGAP